VGGKKFVRVEGWECIIIVFFFYFF